MTLRSHMTQRTHITHITHMTHWYWLTAVCGVDVSLAVARCEAPPDNIHTHDNWSPVSPEIVLSSSDWFPTSASPWPTTQDLYVRRFSEAQLEVASQCKSCKCVSFVMYILLSCLSCVSCVMCDMCGVCDVVTCVLFVMCDMWQVCHVCVMCPVSCVRRPVVCRKM